MRLVEVHVRRLASGRKGRQSTGKLATPTPERMRRAGSDFERGESGQITMRDSPLERAFARRVVNRLQYATAQKYRHHWYHAGLSGQLASIDLGRVFAVDLDNFSGMPRTETQVFHRQRYREATQQIGKIGSYVLDCLVCREVQLHEVGYGLGWSSRSQAYAAAAERMKSALDALGTLWAVGN
jgi:hypothetical protein